jgi:hypothetical protein
MYKNLNKSSETRDISSSPSPIVSSIAMLSLLAGCSTPNAESQQPERQMKSDFKPEYPVKNYPSRDIYSRTSLILAPNELYHHYQINGIRNALGEIEVTEAFYEPYSPLETTLALKKIVNTHNKNTCGENTPQIHWTERDVAQAISTNSRTSIYGNRKTLKVHIVREDCSVYSFSWETGVNQGEIRKRYNDDPNLAFIIGSAPF